MVLTEKEQTGLSKFKHRQAGAKNTFYVVDPHFGRLTKADYLAMEYGKSSVRRNAAFHSSPFYCQQEDNLHADTKSQLTLCSLLQ